MQFKDTGELFSGDFINQMQEISGRRFKGITSISDMQNWQKDSFAKFLKIKSGASNFTVDEIQKKALMSGLTESLTTEAMALAKDATLVEKSATGRLTWGKALKDNKIDIEDIGNALKKSGKISKEHEGLLDEALKLGDKDLITNRVTNIIDEVDELSDSIINLSSNTAKAETSIGSYFTGFIGAIKPLIPLITGAVIAVGTIAAIDYSQHEYTRAVEDANNKATEYDNAKSELASLNTEYENVQDNIKELQKLQAKGTLTYDQEVELENLQKTNSELEIQIGLKKTLADLKGQESAEAMSKAFNTEQTFGEFIDESVGGGIKGKIWGFLANNLPSSLKDEWEEQDTTISGRVEENIKNLKTYENQLKNLQNAYKNDPTNESFLKNQQNLQDKIVKNRNDLLQEADTLQSYIDQLTDENDKPIQGMESYIQSCRDLLTEIQNINKSAKEIDLNNLNNFFSSSNGSLMKKNLESIVKSSGNAEDALKGFKKTGMSLDDINVSEEGFKRYFEDIVKSAQEAEDAINKVNNNITVDDIKTAFESKNSGDDYVSLNDYMKQAKELYDKGLVGTDDFKSVAEMMSYNIDSSAESFSQNYEKLRRYFSEDGDGELTAQGVQNFLTDIEALGKGYATLNTETGQWTFNMENTAQVAKELGMGVGVFESLLGRIQDYDGVGDFHFISAIDEFNDAKIALEGLRKAYDNLEDGSKKDQLGLKLEDWENNLTNWENDLASLDSDIIMNIQLEYDLATIQAEIDEFKNSIDWGNATVENYAGLLSGNQKYIDTAKKGLGLETDGVAIPIEFEASENSIEALKEQLASATSEEEKIQIQAEIVNMQEVQKEFLDAFSNAHPEINAESSFDEVNSALNDFISTTEGKKLIAKLDLNTKDALKKVEDLLGIKFDDKVLKVDADTDQALIKIDEVKQAEFQDKIVNLVAEDEATTVLALWNTLQADDKFATMSVDDQATHIIEYWNSLSPNDKQAFIDSTIQATDNATPIISDVDGKIKKLNKNPNINVRANDKASSVLRSVSSTLNSLDGKTVTTYISTVHTEEYKATGTLPGSTAIHKRGAQLHGTVSSSHFNSAFAKGTVQGNLSVNKQDRTKKSEIALTGELGQEIVVNGNKWWTVGDNGTEFTRIPKNSIVFNHKQTKELFRKGYIDSRGKAYLNGTAYAGESSGSFTFGGGASSYNSSSSSSNSSSNTNNSNDKNNSDSANDSAEEFKETLDAIEILINRIERDIKNIERVAGSAYNTFSKRNKALRNQISSIYEEISIQQQGYNRYLQEAESVPLSEDYKSLVRSGAIDISTITDKDLSENINKYKEWYEKALDCRDAIEELTESVRDLYKQAFDNVVTMYDGMLSQIEHRHNMLEGYVDQTEAQGYIVSTKYYDAMITNEQNKLSKLNKERQDLINALNDAIVNGDIEVESEAWYDMQASINSVNESIQESTTSIIEFKNAIREIEWGIFDKIQDRISTITDEADFLVELMSDEKMYDDNGKVTKHGTATYGLHGVNYNVYMSQADQYRKEMESIQKELSKDPYNETLIERRKELLELQQESILAAEEEKDAIKNLVQEGIEKQLEALDKLIDKYLEAIDSEKDLHDYQKKIKKEQKEIDSLRKQLAAYAGDDSEEGSVKKQQTENKLKEAEENLEESLYDKAISDQKKLLDELYSEYETILNMRLDNIDVLIGEVIANINSDASEIRDTLVSEAEKVGYKLTDSMNTIWGANGTIANILTTYSNNFSSTMTTVQSAINGIKIAIQNAITASNQKATSNISNIDKQQSQQTTVSKPNTPKPDYSSILNSKPATNTNSGGDGVPRIGDKVTYVSGSYFYSSDGLNPSGNQMLGQQVYITNINNASWAQKPYHISRTSRLGEQDLGWVNLNQLSGYKVGAFKIDRDQLGITQEDGNELILGRSDGAMLMPNKKGQLTSLKRGDAVVDADGTDNLLDLANNPNGYIQRMVNKLKMESMAERGEIVGGGQTMNEYNVMVNMSNVTDYEDIFTKLKYDPRTERFVQEVTFGEALGKGKMRKYLI